MNEWIVILNGLGQATQSMETMELFHRDPASKQST